MPTLQQKKIAVPALRGVARSGSGSGGAGGASSSKSATKSRGASPGPAAGEPGRPKRPAMRRWMAAGLILATALLTVVFVGNAIKVNELLAAITSVEAERNAIQQQNERLRAELLRLMSVEQVTARAVQLGMVQPEVPPVALPLKNAASETEQQNESR